MAKYEFYASTRCVGSERTEVVEIPDEELVRKSEEEKDDYIYKEYYLEWLSDNVDQSWREI